MNKEQFEELQDNLHSDFYEQQFEIDNDIILSIFKTNDSVIIDMNMYLEGYEACYQIHTDVTPLPNNLQEFNKLLDEIWHYNNIRIGE